MRTLLINSERSLVLDPQTETKFAADIRVATDEMKASPLWIQLEVVQAQRVYEVGGSHWMGGGYIAANLILKDLRKFLVDSAVAIGHR